MGRRGPRGTVIPRPAGPAVAEGPLEGGLHGLSRANLARPGREQPNPAVGVRGVGAGGATGVKAAPLHGNAAGVRAPSSREGQSHGQGHHDGPSHLKG